MGFNRRFAPFSVRLAEFLAKSAASRWWPITGSTPATCRRSTGCTTRRRAAVASSAKPATSSISWCSWSGRFPNQSSAVALPDSGRYHEDNVALTFEFPDGSLGSVTYLANGDRAFPKERIEVFSAGQVAVLDDFRSLELVKDGRRSAQRSRLRQDKGHRAEWLSFAKAILSGGLPPIPYEHLTGVTRASFAALQALRQRERIAIEQA